MGDIGLWRQAWRWVQSQKQVLMWARAAVCVGQEKFSFMVDRHWPAVYKGCVGLSRFVLNLVMQWRDCAVRGFWSMVHLGPTAVFVILWSCFMCLTSTTCAFYALLTLGAAAASIHYLGYTPGLFIVGLFGILIMWKYGYFWITGMLLIAGGFMCSLKHARFLILVLTAYAVYCIAVRVGGLGVFLTLNVSFFSNDLLNKLLEGYEGANEGTHFEEPKKPEPMMDFFRGYEHPPPSSEPENVSTTSTNSFCSAPTQDIVHTQKDVSTSKVVKSDTMSLEEMKRIMSGLTYYEVLDIPRNKTVDLKILKKEYHKKVLLVHPDKNLGNPLACESFKKLQGAYEVLSDLTKKTSYDEQLRVEEYRSMSQRSHGTSRQNGVEFLSEESRRIECTKCSNFHIWICTRRTKAKARWCQDCSQYHAAKDGDGWVENGFSPLFSSSHKVDIPRAFVCAESKVFDVSEWASCQGMECKPNTHGPSFMVNMVGLDRSPHRSYSSRYPWSLDAEMIPEDEFELWLQQTLASGFFSDSPKRRKSWSPFKLPHKGMKSWRRSP